MVTRLAHATVMARLVDIKGRAIATAKNHHIVVDSPLALGGPNQELNPVDMLLAALASHVIFVCERAAQETGSALTGASARVSGVFEPQMSGGPDSVPYLQSLSVDLRLAGPPEGQASLFASVIRERCLVFTTLSRAVPITLDVSVELGANPT